MSLFINDNIKKLLKRHQFCGNMTENESAAEKSMHLAIIPDGNRRYAKRLMQQPWKGHEAGIKKFEEILNWCKELGIKKITFYIFSLKNFASRPKDEIKYLFDLFLKEFRRWKNDARIHQEQIRINFIGRLWLLPEEIQDAMQQLMQATKTYTRYFINFAIAYDGRAEIVDAIKSIASEVKEGKIKVDEIDESVVEKHLYLPDDVDLIIRTSGEYRTSSFLPWQADYAEFSPITEYYPELSKEKFVHAVNEFKKRERRFGK